MNEDPIYLDHNGTTPVDPEVLEAMLPWLRDGFGNPSSSSERGRRAKQAVETAREAVAELLGAEADEIVFTSGGTESNNHALLGAARLAERNGRHLITSNIEHPAVSQVCRILEMEGGWEVTEVPVEPSGILQTERVERAIRPDTTLVSVMHSNNEIGTLQPVAAIAALCRSRGILLHTDAAQSIGKVPVKAAELAADFISLAGHKFHAPKGTGALFIRRGLDLPRFMHGAGQESGRRAGTENVPGWVALGRACGIASRDFDRNARAMRRTRDLLHGKLAEQVPGLTLHGDAELRLPNTLSVAFPGVRSDKLLERIDSRVCASAGAACHSGSAGVSHVLEAIGEKEEFHRGTLRFSTGKLTTDEGVIAAATAVADAWRALRAF